MNEPQATRAYGLEKNRLEALADGIFAVSLTLLVLDIKLPDNASATTHDELVRNLVGLERHLVIYVISFVVIGIFWINHHIQFHFVRRTDRGLIWINLLYLLLVSFVPFATDLIGDHKELVLPCEIYGLALLALSATSLVHLQYLVRHPELASSELNDDVYRTIRRRIQVSAIVPLLSMLAALLSTHVAVYVYLLLVTAHFFPGTVDERSGTRRKEGLPI
jgi:TMEM175 potassium channel family protein